METARTDWSHYNVLQLARVSKFPLIHCWSSDPPRVRFPYDAIFLFLRKDHQKATVTVYIHDDFGNEDSDNLQLSRRRLE